MYKDYLSIKNGFSSNLFGRQEIKDWMHSEDGKSLMWTLERGYKGSSEDATYLGGRPLVRGLAAAGGPTHAYLNTEVAGGADDPTDLTKSGNFNNVFGVGLIGYSGEMDNMGMVWFQNLATQPVAGDTLTGATSGVTMVVTGTFATADEQSWCLGTITKNYAGGVRYDHFVVGENVTSDNAGAVMAPTPAVVRRADFNIHDEANTTTAIAVTDTEGDPYSEMMVIGIRGLFEAYFQGDVAGTGYNGAGADGTDVTYNDDIDAFCAAAYHAKADLGAAEVWVNPDNVYGHLQEAVAVNASHVPQMSTTYFKFDEPNVHVGGDGSEQGVEPEAQA